MYPSLLPIDGLPLGDVLGVLDGLALGDALGLRDGLTEGLAVGSVLGLVLGDALGVLDGLALGDALGVRDGLALGNPDRLIFSFFLFWQQNRQSHNSAITTNHTITFYNSIFKVCNVDWITHPPAAVT